MGSSTRWSQHSFGGIKESQMKRNESLHIIVIPKLFTPVWLHQLYKVADCNFIIPSHYSFWDSHNYENLIVVLVFPFLPFRPWQLNGTPKMFAMDRDLCTMFKQKEMDTWNFLRKFLLVCGKFSTMSLDVVWKMLYLKNEILFSHSLCTDAWNVRRKRSRDEGGIGETSHNISVKRQVDIAISVR